MNSILNKETNTVPRILVNLGCGQTRPHGWINTDSSLNSWLQNLPLFHKVVAQLFQSVNYDSNASYMDLRHSWRFSNNSVDVVYASHVFEHLNSSTAVLFLNEAYRVLKPGGIIRLVVPDLHQLAKNYIDEYKSGNKSATRDFLYWMNLCRDNTYPKNRSTIVKIINFLQDYPHQHKYMYDFTSLSQMLSDSKYIDLQQASYAQSKYISEINQVEYTSEGVASIYIEAKKPSQLAQLT
jgi:predicted SAM-dependent methyltransferase